MRPDCLDSEIRSALCVDLFALQALKPNFELYQDTSMKFGNT